MIDGESSPASDRFLAAPEPEPARYGSAMARRFGPWVHLLGLARGLARLRLEERGVELLRAAAAAGPPIYVLPRRSGLDHLALNAALAARRLPLSVWAPGVRTGWTRPIAAAWRALRQRWAEGPVADPITSGAVVEMLRAGQPIVLFVDDRASLGRPRQGPDPFSVLVDAARLPRPPQLVPLVVVWDRSPDVDSAVHRFFLGKAGVPGLVRRWWRALRSADAWIQVGDPIDLATIRDRVPPDRLPGLMRRLAGRAVRAEAKLVRGPRLLPHRTLKNLVLDNPPMRELAKEEAATQGLPVERVVRKMEREYDKIAANFSWTIITLLHLVLRPLWTRVFSGVDVPDEDIDRLRAAMRDGTPILVPCHKSHFDYVLLSWVLYDHDLIVPHVVAGLNLAVWPVSILLRGAGGFFIKRSFAGDRIFPAVFARYFRELVRQEYPVEFFIEGGRTRSGKLMAPKLGVLQMVLDSAEVRNHGREVTILPVALAYEQVAEEGVYARELGGEKKSPESLGQLVRARSVLRRRFGRVYLRIGTPIPVSPLVDPAADRPAWSDRDRDQRKAELQALGERIVARIGDRMVLLPTSLVALALLAHPRRAVRHAELLERIQRLDALLRLAGLPRAASLARFDEAVSQALDRFVRDRRIEPLEHDGERLWSIDPDQRITLDFYKNQVLHALAPAGLAACALRASPEGAVSTTALLPAFDALRSWWRRELVWDPDRAGEDRLREGLAHLVAHGAVRPRDGDAWEVVDTARIGEIYGLFRPLLEGYAVVLGAGAFLPATRDELPAAIQGAQAELLASGKVTRPESLSLVTLQNAIATLTEDRVLVPDGDGRLALDPDAVASRWVGIRPMVEP